MVTSPAVGSVMPICAGNPSPRFVTMLVDDVCQSVCQWAG